MESSLNLNTLANSLPSSSQAISEKELLSDFKAAALSITTLYRSSRRTSKRAYNTGYASACRDLLEFIQHGVSAGGAGNEEGGVGGMTIGRVMDWVEARIEAIKAREEEEDEEGCGDGVDGRARLTTQAGSGSTDKRGDGEKSNTQTYATQDASHISLQPTRMTSSQPRQSSTSPSPPPPPTPTPVLVQPSAKRSLRQRSGREKDKDKGKDRENFSIPSKEPLQQNNFPFASPTPPYAPQTTFSIDMDALTPPFTVTPSLQSPVLAGMKRRYATLTDAAGHSYHSATTTSPVSAHQILPSTNSSAGMSGANRRKTRATGGPGGSVVIRSSLASQAPNSAKSESAVHVILPGHQNSSNVSMAMDIEEESGRERKRVARR